MNFVLLILISLLPLVALFQPGLPITHDGQDHVARIANFYQNLSEGNIVPRWAGNLNWGYGHPILMFLYPLPSYVASLFHFLGFSLVDSTKIVFGLAFILSGFAMYMWTKTFLTKEGALFSAALYILAPYRFIDLYVRGAIGEHIAFVFLPLTLYFLKKRNIVGLALSFSGLLLSHNAISLIFLPIIILYASYLFWQIKDRRDFLIQSIVSILLGFGLASFFLLPAFFEGKYTLRDIVTAGSYATSFVSWQRFLYSPWSFGGTGQFSPQIGIIQWIVVFASLPVAVLLKKRNNPLSLFTLGTLIIFFCSLFIMTSASDFLWQLFTILQKFQFPWRFLSITVFTTSVLGGICFSSLIKKKQIAVLFVGILLLLFINKDYWHANGYLQKPEEFFTSIYNSTTDTGESSPIWSVRFMENRPDAHIEIVDGKVHIKELTRLVTHRVYEIESSGTALLVENTLYFPGWQVLIDGKEVKTEFQNEQHRGLMTFPVENGLHKVDIVFQETKLRFISDIISIVSIIVLGATKLWKKYL